MKTNPKVSVIITTYNSSRTLDKCLRAITNQSYKNIELIVVDNNSTDSSFEIAKKYTNKIFTKGPERSAQRNFGAKVSTGEILLIHDSDIYFNPQTISDCINVLIKNECDAVILPEESVGQGFWTKVKAFERSFYLGNNLIEGPRFFKKSVFEKLGGFDENLTGPEDWDFYIRLRNAGYKVCRSLYFVQHDEGRLTLLGSSKKKQYYAKDFFSKYSKMHPEEFRKQMSFFYRFPLHKILKNFVYHPILTISMILMKSIEFLRSKGI